MAGVFASLAFPLFFVGMLVGTVQGSNSTRDKVVVYCIEQPKLCKKEYDVITTKTKLDNYQPPEIK